MPDWIWYFKFHLLAIYFIHTTTLLNIYCFLSFCLSAKFLSFLFYFYISRISVSIHLFIHLSVYLAIFPSIVSIYLSIYIYICLSIHLSIYPSIPPSIYLSIYLSVYLFIYLSIHLCCIFGRNTFCSGMYIHVGQKMRKLLNSIDQIRLKFWLIFKQKRIKLYILLKLKQALFIFPNELLF